MTHARILRVALSRNGISPSSDRDFAPVHSLTSLTLPSGLSYERWAEYGVSLEGIGRAILWLIGDWYLYGEREYGEQAAQAVGDETGYAARTVQNAAWVAGRFDPARRRENVDFGTHAALAGVEGPEARYALLQRAAEERWTRQQVREAVRMLKHDGAKVTRAPGKHTVETARLFLAWYPVTGVHLIQDRAERSCGVTIAADYLTPEARRVLRDVLRHHSGGDAR